MNKTFKRRTVNDKKFNILALPGTNMFKFEVINLYGSHVERVIAELQEKNVYGISHFIEHLGFRAPRDYTTPELMSIIKTEGMYNASTSPERINYWFKTTMDRVDLAVDLVCNYAFNDLTGISPDEFAIEKKVVYNEAKRYADNDQTMFSFNTDVITCGYHEHDNILGVPEIIDTFTLEDVIHIKDIMMQNGDVVYNVTYDPEIMDIDDIINKIDMVSDTFYDVIESTDHSKVADLYYAMQKMPAVGEFTCDNEAEQAMTSLTFDVIKNKHTATIANSYLLSYATDTSLNDIIREQHGLTYGVGFYIDKVSYTDVTRFACDVSKGDEYKLMQLFNESINKSVDAFDEAKYDTLMATIKLKRVMMLLDQQNYNMFHVLAVFNPELIDVVEGVLSENIVDGLDGLDNEHASFADIKEYLTNMQLLVNAGTYAKLTNV